jgi:hypothetical protein
MREYRRQSKTLGAINWVSPTENERPAVDPPVLVAFGGICRHEAQHLLQRIIILKGNVLLAEKCQPLTFQTYVPVV